jgi:plastocyanin
MTKRKRELTIIFLIIGGAVLFRVVLALATSVAGGPSAPVNTANLPVQSGHVTVTISNREYHPAILVITPGTTVTWVNRDPMAHNVTEGQRASATAQGFHSGVLASGQSWTDTFHTSGTFAYTCTFHPDMNGYIVIKQKS